MPSATRKKRIKDNIIHFLVVVIYMVPRIKIGTAGNYFQARVRQGIFKIIRRSHPRKQQGSIVSAPPAGEGDVATSSCSLVLVLLVGYCCS